MKIMKNVCLFILMSVLPSFAADKIKQNASTAGTPTAVNKQPSSDTTSMKEFMQGEQKLIVYADVPGNKASERYQIRVRSALTKNEWVDCFAHNTYNKAKELGGKPVPQVDGKILKTGVRHYVLFFSDWSHTYANIEMSPNTPVEVEISSKNGFKIGGENFEKAAAHPAHRVVKQPEVKAGKIYFTMDQPAFVTIDINGQMDDFNKTVDDKSPNGDYVAHTISFFANPVIKKPLIGEPGVVVVEPGAKPPLQSDAYTTLYFKPGVHDVGVNFKIHPGKSYYIPGDAIVFGTLNNVDVPAVGNQQPGENIKVYGTGTLSASKISHPAYVPGEKDDLEYNGIAIQKAVNAVVEGICVTDPANHSVKLQGYSKRSEPPREKTFAKWVKVISWRANGDGIGSADLAEDCFIRTSDDCSYIKGNRRRCVFWQDRGAAVFHMAGIPNKPIVIEDCDVIYNRARGDTAGGVFVQRGEGKVGVQKVDVIVRNFRVTDPRANAATFKLCSEEGGRHGIGSSYSGMKFQNVTITHPIVGAQKLKIIGCEEAPWKGGITFEKVTVAGKKITDLSSFETNKFVSEIVFK